MQPHIVVVGSINRDLSVGVEALPRKGQTVLGGEFQSLAGGKGANQAVAAARFGASVSFVGRVGADAFGDELVEALCAEGVDIRHVTRDEQAASGVALILVDENGDNCITVAPGANARVTAEDVEAARDVIAAADVVLLQLEVPVPAVRRAAEIADAHGVPVVLNPAPACALDDALLGLVSVFTPNVSEAEFYTGQSIAGDAQARAAARAIAETVGGDVVMTVGPDGACYTTPQGVERVPGYAVDAVDTTAAGDVFNGVLSVCLAEGEALPEAIACANAAAAVSVTRRGAQAAAPSREEADALRHEAHAPALSY